MIKLFGNPVSATKGISYALQSILLKELNADYKHYKENDRQFPEGHEKRQAIFDNMLHLTLTTEK